MMDSFQSNAKMPAPWEVSGTSQGMSPHTNIANEVSSALYTLNDRIHSAATRVEGLANQFEGCRPESSDKQAEAATIREQLQQIDNTLCRLEAQLNRIA